MVTERLVLFKGHIGNQVFYIKGTFHAPIEKQKIPYSDSDQLGGGEGRLRWEAAHA